MHDQVLMPLDVDENEHSLPGVLMHSAFLAELPVAPITNTIFFQSHPSFTLYFLEVV